MRAIAIATVGLSGLAACTSLTRPRPDPGLDLSHLPPTTWELRVGESRTLDYLQVRFIGVPEDSRCPVDAACPWAGNAVVQLNAEHAWADAPAYPIRLNTGTEPRSAEAYGVRITLVALRPEPHAGVPIRQDAYRVELRLSGVNAEAP